MLTLTQAMLFWVSQKAPDLFYGQDDGTELSPTFVRVDGALFGDCPKDGDRVVFSLVEMGAIAPVDDMGPVRRLSSLWMFIDNRLKTSRWCN